MKKRPFLKYIIEIISVVTIIVCVCVFVKNSAASSVASTLLGSLLTVIITSFYNDIKSIKSDFAGYYRDEIFSRDNPGEIIKRDKFQLNENDGRVLSGNFKRYMPEESKYTNWQCSGFIVLDQYLLSYRAVNDTTPSRGVIIVKLDTERTNGLLPCYTGKYYKFEGERIIDHKINLIKIEEDDYLGL